MDSYRWRPVAGSLAQARLNRSAKGAGTGHSPRYPKCGTTQSDRLLGVRSDPTTSLRPPKEQTRRSAHAKGTVEMDLMRNAACNLSERPCRSRTGQDGQYGDAPTKPRR